MHVKRSQLQVMKQRIQMTPVADLLIGLTGWSLGPQNLGGLRPGCITIFDTIIALSYLCCHNTLFCYSALYSLNNPLLIFLAQLYSISEYCRISNTPHHHRLYSNWLNTLPSSSRREGGRIGGASEIAYGLSSSKPGAEWHQTFHFMPIHENWHQRK